MLTFYPSRIPDPGVQRHRIPDPDPQHWDPDPDKVPYQEIMIRIRIRIGIETMTIQYTDWRHYKTPINCSLPGCPWLAGGTRAGAGREGEVCRHCHLHGGRKTLFPRHAAVDGAGAAVAGPGGRGRRGGGGAGWGEGTHPDGEGQHGITGALVVGCCRGCRLRLLGITLRKKLSKGSRVPDSFRMFLGSPGSGSVIFCTDPDCYAFGPLGSGSVIICTDPDRYVFKPPGP